MNDSEAQRTEYLTEIAARQRQATALSIVVKLEAQKTEALASWKKPQRT
jgi:hypothetical protein